MHWAVREGKGRVIEKLLNHNIDITLKTNSYQTAEDIAESKGYEKVFRFVLHLILIDFWLNSNVFCIFS